MGSTALADWSLAEREERLLAMERSPMRDTEIGALLKDTLTSRVDDHQVYTRGIDASYRYEGCAAYTMDGLDS